jgi:C_GCAxxG_C_C family probable redox protein
MHSPRVAQAQRSAEDAFNSGLYCAESVALAVAQAQGVQSDLLPRLATAFCSGMARTGGPCGALTGALIGMGLALGRSQADQPVQGCYAATQQLMREFERTFGARNCSDLLGCDLGTPEGQATFRDQQLKQRCLEFTGTAAAIAVRLIEADRSAGGQG